MADDGGQCPPAAAAAGCPLVVLARPAGPLPADRRAAATHRGAGGLCPLLPRQTLGGDAATRRHRPGADAAPARPPDGRALRRPRRNHPRPNEPGTSPLVGGAVVNLLLRHLIEKKRPSSSP